MVLLILMCFVLMQRSKTQATLEKIDTRGMRSIASLFAKRS
jgi:preprotein translocase subunit SecG